MFIRKEFVHITWGGRWSSLMILKICQILFPEHLLKAILLADRVFSYIEIGQPHEQNNKVVKVDGEANDISESKRTLFEWALSGPYIDGMVRK